MNDHEIRQRPVGPDWAEYHRLFAVDDRRVRALAFQVGITKRGSDGSASLHCVILEPGLLPVVIVDDEIPVPADRWELRTSGLWADTICETPYGHWSYGLEAFGLAIDDRREMLGRGFGMRVPLGWELEFESTPDRVVRLEPDGGSAYSQPGRVDGLLLFGDGSKGFSGPAIRQHWWGDPATAPMAGLDAAIAIGAEPRRQACADGPGPRGPRDEPDHDGPLDTVELPMPGAVWVVGFTAEGLRSTTVSPAAP